MKKIFFQYALLSGALFWLSDLVKKNIFFEIHENKKAIGLVQRK